MAGTKVESSPPVIATPLKYPLAIALAIAACLSAASAQTPSPTPTPGTRVGYWEAVLPGGTYVVSLVSITSISQREYLVDGAARVHEVNIDTLGAVQSRFYYIEPATPQAPGGIGQSTLNFVDEKARELASRAGADDVSKKVVKNYPTTTHAHTVEYRIDSLDTLNNLFRDIRTAWLTQHTGSFKP